MKLALTLCLALLAPQSGAPRFQIELADDQGELVCTLQADNAPLYDVLRELSERSGLSLDGFDSSWRKTLISADLRRRPLRQTLAFVLGSVGLDAEVRQGAIFLREGLESSTDSDALHDAALAGYLRTLRDFPEHALAAEAERSQAWIEERRGRLSAARAHYESLVERHADSPLVPEALFKSGELLMREGAWQDASNRLSELLRMQREHDFEARARLELAWCVAELGENERALYMIEALDAVEAPATPQEELRRAQVRIRAMAGLGQARQALTLLDELDARLVGAVDKRSSLELRAVACTAAGMRAEAARAWLAYAQLVDGAPRESALRQAATLALESNDELGALFVAKAARDAGVELTEVARDARARLELEDQELSGVTSLQRLARAERLLEAGMTGESLSTLRVIAPVAATLAQAERARFTLAYGRALAAEVGVDAALAHFREQLSAIEDAELRRQVYVLAGELLETEGRLDEAIEAYQGRI